MLTAVINIWLELAPWLLIGAAAAGLLHILVPQGWMQRHLSGPMGVLKAVIIGVPLPLCSCGVIPVGLGLRKSGASQGAAVGFLISTPQTGIDSVLISASFLGWPFAILKVAVALVTGFTGGLLTDLTSAHDNGSGGAEQDVVANHRSEPWKEFLHHSGMLIQSIRGWLIIGVLVSAAITWLIPEQSLASIPALTGLSALLITMVISLPLYVCATASVPIAAALVAGGLPTGAALVFLMAGPATNVATLGAIFRTLGLRSMLVYLSTIVAGSLVAGLAFNQLLVVNVTHLHAHDHLTGWWRILSAVVLAGLIAWSAYQDATRWFRRRSMQSAPFGGAVTVKVTGMTCNGCAAKLERSLEATSNVQSAAVSFERGEAIVHGTASPEDIRHAVNNAGFQTVEQ
ncbi:MAG: permease [Planctomycetaceae bacterium]